MIIVYIIFITPFSGYYKNLNMPSTRRGPQPYDLDNPANWTANKLKNELETLGFKLSSTIPKSALIQIYQKNCVKPELGQNLQLEIQILVSLKQSLIWLQVIRSTHRTPSTLKSLYTTLTNFST